MHACHAPIQQRASPDESERDTWTSHGCMGPPERLNCHKSTCTLGTDLRAHRTTTPRKHMLRPRFLINPNRGSTQLTVVKPRSTWVLTSKNSPTNSIEPFDLVDTHVGPTHGQRLGQIPLKPWCP
jgi:hypothetical protein